MTPQFNFSLRNTKLKKDNIAAFNIPAFKADDGFVTCPNAGVCAGVCYARQGYFMFGLAKQYAEDNLALIRKKLNQGKRGRIWLVDTLSSQIANLPRRFTRVRPHSSGDFFSPYYFDVWLDVIRLNSDKYFYAYTKQIEEYHKRLKLIDRLDNFHIIQSVGGKQDHLIDTALPHSRIFLSTEHVHAAGYVDGSESEKPALARERRIGLVYHGTRNVTGQQAKALVKLRVA